MIGVLLGMAAAKRGTMDAATSKMLFLHLPTRWAPGAAGPGLLPAAAAAVARLLCTPRAAFSWDPLLLGTCVDSASRPRCTRSCQAQSCSAWAAAGTRQSMQSWSSGTWAQRTLSQQAALRVLMPRARPLCMLNMLSMGSCRHPATYPELELSHLVQSAALLGVGLLYQESCHRRARAPLPRAHVAEQRCLVQQHLRRVGQGTCAGKCCAQGMCCGLHGWWT